ncbi:MAG: glycosyltransferase family 2 protein, partial [Primorskyibacter sp.]
NEHIAYVPQAVVHHATAPSPLRRADRVPRTLHELAASQVVFQRKHTPVADHPQAWRAFACDQGARLQRHMQTGALGPEEVTALRRSMDRGAAQGRARAIPTLGARRVSVPSVGAVLPARLQARRVMIVGWLWQARALTRLAQQHVKQGCQVMVLRLSPTALYHHVRFMPGGYWLQSGGLFGRSVRTSPMMRIISRRRRAAMEMRRVAVLRGDSLDFDIVFVDSVL